MSNAAVLRANDSGPAVRDWQLDLCDAGYPVELNSEFGEETEKATKALQRAAGLPVDGVAGPRTREAAAKLGERPSLMSNPPFPALTEVKKDAAFGALTWSPAEPPAGTIKITAGLDLIEVELPQLHGVFGAPASHRVLFHRVAADRLRELFDAWEHAGLLDQVLSWAGSFAPRRVRGGMEISSHARGIAFDINADYNPRGRAPVVAGLRGSVVELVPIAWSLGFFWGGNFSTPDAMHWEIGWI